jgi:hypothetical protein
MTTLVTTSIKILADRRLRPNTRGHNYFSDELEFHIARGKACFLGDVSGAGAGFLVFPLPFLSTRSWQIPRDRDRLRDSEKIAHLITQRTLANLFFSFE